MDSTADAIDIEILRQLKEVTTQPSTGVSTKNDTDEDFAYGRSIALSLKKLQPQQKSMAKLKIQQVLHDIEFLPPLPPLSYPPREQYPGYYEPNCNGGN